jgi:hypothetical protein
VALPVFVPMVTYGTRGLEDVQAAVPTSTSPISLPMSCRVRSIRFGVRDHALYARLSGNRAENVVFPTFTVLLLAFAGWRRGRQGSAPWLAVAAVFIVLTLGPFLHIAGASAIEPRPGTFWRCRSEALVSTTCRCSRGRVRRGRFASAGQLGLVMAAMLGLAAVARAGNAASRRGWLFAAIACVAFECLAWPLPTTRVDVPPAYHVLAAEARSRGVHGALLEIPPAHSEDKVYQMYQTVHGLPLLGGRLRVVRPCLRPLAPRPIPDRTFSSDPWRANDGGLSLDGLDSLHVDYVMLHTRLAAAGAIARVLSRTSNSCRRTGKRNFFGDARPPLESRVQRTPSCSKIGSMQSTSTVRLILREHQPGAYWREFDSILLPRVLSFTGETASNRFNRQLKWFENEPTSD